MENGLHLEDHDSEAESLIPLERCSSRLTSVSWRIYICKSVTCSNIRWISDAQIRERVSKREVQEIHVFPFPVLICFPWIPSVPSHSRAADFFRRFQFGLGLQKQKRSSGSQTLKWRPKPLEPFNLWVRSIFNITPWEITIFILLSSYYFQLIILLDIWDGHSASFCWYFVERFRWIQSDDDQQ